jgi:hypothetical protein
MDLAKRFECFFSKRGEIVMRKDMPNMTLAKMRLASHPEAKAESLKKLSTHECESLVARVAENPNTPMEVLEELARHPCPYVRAALCENENTPARILTMLADDEHVDVRYSLAENHNTPQAVLTRLAHDENPYVADRAQRTILRVRSTVTVETNDQNIFGQRNRQRDVG